MRWRKGSEGRRRKRSRLFFFWCVCVRDVRLFCREGGVVGGNGGGGLGQELFSDSTSRLSSVSPRLYLSLSARPPFPDSAIYGNSFDDPTDLPNSSTMSPSRIYQGSAHPRTFHGPGFLLSSSGDRTIDDVTFLGR